MKEREENSWQVGDPVIEWGGRAEGGTDQQFEFSDLMKLEKRGCEELQDGQKPRRK